MKILIGLILIVLCHTASAECRRPLLEPLFIASTVAQLADYSTTLSIARSNRRFSEQSYITRKIIGNNPTTGRVQRYFMGRLLISGVIQCYAPDPWNRIILWGQTVTHGGAAIHNFNIGLRFSW